MDTYPQSLTLPGAWVAAPSLSEEQLTGTFWTYGLLDCLPFTPFLVLAPDGLVGNYRHPNEDSWLVQDGRLAFMSDRGVCTTLFEAAKLQGGRIVGLAGRIRLAGSEQVVELRRTDHPVHPLYPTPSDTNREAEFIKTCEGPHRPNLVVLRAGNGSLHSSWTRDLTDQERSWDLCISFYGGADALPQDAEYLTYQPKQRKFPAIYDLFRPGSPLWGYDRIWMPDDDLMTGWGDINLLFHLSRKHGLDLSQPSLQQRPDCYITHEITMQQPESTLRFVSFVELMCPIFSKRALEICIGSFRDCISGFGLDHLWPSFLGTPHVKVAIMDQVGIVHTRPVGVNYDLHQAAAEGLAMLDVYKIGFFRFPHQKVPF